MYLFLFSFIFLKPYFLIHNLITNFLLHFFFFKNLVSIFNAFLLLFVGNQWSVNSIFIKDTWDWFHNYVTLNEILLIHSIINNSSDLIKKSNPPPTKYLSLRKGFLTNKSHAIHCKYGGYWGVSQLMSDKQIQLIIQKLFIIIYTHYFLGVFLYFGSIVAISKAIREFTYSINI